MEKLTLKAQEELETQQGPDKARMTAWQAGNLQVSLDCVTQ